MLMSLKVARNTDEFECCLSPNTWCGLTSRSRLLNRAMLCCASCCGGAVAWAFTPLPLFLFVCVAQDYGVPQNTTTEHLKMHVHNEAVPVETLAAGTSGRVRVFVSQSPVQIVVCVWPTLLSSRSILMNLNVAPVRIDGVD